MPTSVDGKRGRGGSGVHVPAKHTKRVHTWRARRMLVAPDATHHVLHNVTDIRTTTSSQGDSGVPRDVQHERRGGGAVQGKRDAGTSGHARGSYDRRANGKLASHVREGRRVKRKETSPVYGFGRTPRRQCPDSTRPKDVRSEQQTRRLCAHRPRPSIHRQAHMCPRASMRRHNRAARKELPTCVSTS